MGELAGTKHSSVTSLHHAIVLEEDSRERGYPSFLSQDLCDWELRTLTLMTESKQPRLY